MTARFLLISFLFVTAGSGSHASANSQIKRIETKSAVRLGIFAVRGNRTFSYRENERFAYCSTFKWILCAAILKKVETKQLSLTQKIPYSKKDLVSHSPMTSVHLSEGGMTVGDLCAATIQVSDNAAANLLFPFVGGTAGLTSFVRTLGDSTTRFDRLEPDMNSNIPGDPRDTTTARSMSYLLRSVLSGQALRKESQNQLLSWLKGTTTGKNRIRAAVPANWPVGNKTGAGKNRAVNDVAVILPPKGEPIYISVFTNGKESDLKAHERAIAEATEMALKALE